MTRFATLLIGVLLAGGIGRTGAPESSPQRPRCTLNQGADARGGPITIPVSPGAAGKGPEEPPHDVSGVLHPVADVPLPGRPVRFDYQSLDSAAGRLYISHMNDAHVEVFDLRSRKVLARVAETPGVTGVTCCGC